MAYDKLINASLLGKFLENIVRRFAQKERGIEYIRGTWTAASGTWTGVSEDEELYDGKQIILFMPFAGSGNATLNLTLADGTTTGAVNVYFESTTRFTTQKGTNSQLHLIYHESQNIGGTNYTGWWYLANRDTNDYAVHIGFNYGLWVTKTLLYRYQILLTVDETTLVPVNAVSNNTGTGKTLTAEAFDPFGGVYYYNSTTTISAGDAIGASIRTQHGLVDLRYSFNTGKTLTPNRSVYLVMEPQSDGTAKLAATPIAQSLPATEDGKLYKYLGRAYDTYRIVLYQEKPVFYFKSGEIRLWTNQTDIEGGGTITGITMNGTSMGTSGVVDLGTVITSHQDISGKVSVTGDTITGDLDITGGESFPLDSEQPLQPQSTHGINFVDENNSGAIWGSLSGYHYNTGVDRGGLMLSGGHGSSYGATNILGLYTNANGDDIVYVSSPDAWRSAMFQGTDVVPVYMGGTGQTDVESVTTISNVITAGSGFSITNATYKQWGKVAQLYFQASKTAAQTSEASMTVGTVVSGKRPAVLAGMICTDTAINYTYLAAGGTVSARGTWAAGATKTFVATYILP